MKKRIRLIYNNGAEYRTTIIFDDPPRRIAMGKAVFIISNSESDTQCYFQTDTIPQIHEIEV